MLTTKKTLEPIDDTNYLIKDLEITDIVPNIIDNYVIYIDEEGFHTIHLPLNETTQETKIWRNGPGGIFSKDVLNFCRKKAHGKYLQIKGDDLNVIARIISEDEESFFKSLKLIDGQLKDTSFMILRHLNDDDNLTSVKNHAVDKNFFELEETINIVPIKITTHEDFEPLVGSISLFND